METRALLSAGDLDVNWGSGGTVTTDFGTPTNFRSELATAVAVQSNGRIVTAGISSDANGQQLFAVSRHFADGDIDTTFGAGGRVLTDFSTPGNLNANSLAQAVAIDSLGRILVAGRTGTLSGDELTIARYNTDGSLDTNFENDGKAILTSVADSVSDVSLIIDDNDRPIIGFTRAQGIEADIAMVRLTESGFLDGSFGGGSVAFTNVSNLEFAGGLAIDGDGNILQTGWAYFPSENNAHLVVAKFDNDGDAITSGYGNVAAGHFFGSFPLDGSRSVMVDTDGSLLIAGVEQFVNENTGLFSGKLTMVRVAPDGSSAVTAQPGLVNDSLTWGMAADRDGKILIAGDNLSFETGEQHYVVARLTGQLTLDTPFGDADGTADGKYVAPENFTTAIGVVADSEGQILAAGTHSGTNNESGNFLLARHDTAAVPGEPVVSADANARENDDPYAVQEGNTLTLSGAGSVTAGSGGTIAFVQNQRRAQDNATGGNGEVVLDWDLDADGEFDDATGEAPVLNAAALDGPQTITVALRVSDASDPQNFVIDTAQVTVNNRAPNASIVMPGGAVEGQSLTINSSVSDVAADTFTYAWQLSDGTTTLTGDDPSFTFTPADNGTWTVNLRVHDDDGGQVDAQTQTLVVDNENPTATINAGASTVAEGTQVGFASTTHDVPADELTFEWIAKKAGVNYATGNDDTFAFTPDDNAVYEVTLKVTDGDGGSVDAQPVFVQATNVTPAPDITGDTLGVRGESRTLNLNATDPGAVDTTSGFTYTVNWGDGSPIETYAPGTTTATHVYTANGSYSAQITAEDKDEAVSEPFVVTMVTQTAALDNGHLLVSGNGGHDRLRVFRNGTQVLVAVSDEAGGGQEFVQTYTGVTRITMNGRGGDDTLDASGMTGIPVEIFGGNGDDKITGGSAADILIGGNGVDKLTGLAGRDVMIGGRDEDRLFGDSDEDIIVGGYSSHDGNLDALRLISDEWRSSRTYQTRVNNIRGPVTSGVNGSAFLRADATVFDDAAIDRMTGDAGRDWFFFNDDNNNSTTRDRVLDANSNEMLDETDLEP